MSCASSGCRSCRPARNPLYRHVERPAPGSTDPANFFLAKASGAKHAVPPPANRRGHCGVRARRRSDRLAAVDGAGLGLEVTDPERDLPGGEVLADLVDRGGLLEVRPVQLLVVNAHD